jgi:flagellar assembly protein FliH
MALKLEIFDTGTSASARGETVVLDTLALEEAKLAAYDAGYRAGWDDAAAAQSDDQARIGADLARNLQALSFTYHEARQHVLRALEPLLAGIVDRILPQTAHAALAPMILDTLRPIAAEVSEPPVSVVINPAARPAVAALLDRATAPPVRIVEEPTLGEGQAYLRFDAAEIRIDLDEAAARISAAVHDFFALNRQESQNG